MRGSRSRVVPGRDPNRCIDVDATITWCSGVDMICICKRAHSASAIFITRASASVVEARAPSLCTALVGLLSPFRSLQFLHSSCPLRSAPRCATLFLPRAGDDAWPRIHLALARRRSTRTCAAACSSKRGRRERTRPAPRAPAAICRKLTEPTADQSPTPEPGRRSLQNRIWAIGKFGQAV